MKNYFLRLWATVTYKFWNSFSVLLAFIFILYTVYMTNGPTILLGIPDTKAFANFIDPIIGIFTFILAAVIGLQNHLRAWGESLEKRLSVCFLYQYDKTIYQKFADDDLPKLKRMHLQQTKLLAEIEQQLKAKRKENYKTPEDWDHHILGLEILEDKLDEVKLQQEEIYNAITHEELKLKADTLYPMIIYFESMLGNEGDMRAWAQQLGAQAEGGRFLHFLPYQYYSKKEKIRITEGGKPKFIMHYIFGYYLKSIPNVIRKKEHTLVFDDNYDDSPSHEVYTIPLHKISTEHMKNHHRLRAFVKHLKDRLQIHLQGS